MAALAALLQATAAPAGGAGWTWSLYEGDGPLVLANEIPDTPNLRTTLECTPGSGAVELTLYGPVVGPGFVSVTAGDASTASEARSGRGRSIALMLRVDHPVFIAFAADGDLQVRAGGSSAQVAVPSAHLPKLRRFADLCAG